MYFCLASQNADSWWQGLRLLIKGNDDEIAIRTKYISANVYTRP